MSIKRLIKSHIENLQTQIYTQLPAIITDVSQYESSNIISVTPTINILHSDGQVNECPEIFNVPVVQPSGGGGLLSFPLAVGDNVLLEFSMRNIEEWLEGSGEAVTEPTRRLHDISDAVAIVGMHTKNNHLSPDPNDVVLKFKDNKITLKNDGNVEVITKAKFSVNNDAEELINVLSEAIEAIANTTVNTTYGLSPLNAKPQILAIKDRLDSFKK